MYTKQFYFDGDQVVLMSLIMVKEAANPAIDPNKVSPNIRNNVTTFARGDGKRRAMRRRSARLEILEQSLQDKYLRR